MVSCQKGPTRHAYAWQIGPFWQGTLEIWTYIFAYKCASLCIGNMFGYSWINLLVPYRIKSAFFDGSEPLSMQLRWISAGILFTRRTLSKGRFQPMNNKYLGQDLGSIRIIFAPKVRGYVQDMRIICAWHKHRTSCIEIGFDYSRQILYSLISQV